MVAVTSVGQRFTQLIQQLGLSKNAFALSLDKTATVIQHLVDERNKPGYDLICKVFEVYPNVSKDWLLLGQGPMMLTANSALPSTSAVAIPPPVVAAIQPSPTQAPALVAPAPTTQSAAEIPSARPAPASAPAFIAPSPAATLPPSELAAPPAPAEPALAAPGTAAPMPQALPAGPDAAYITAAIHAQHLQHQLALAEQRNQHLLEQQQLMQQMLDLMRRTV